MFYSACQTTYSGRYSLLAHGLEEHITGESFGPFSRVLSDDKPWYENMWLGTLGYDLKHCQETLPVDSPATIILPPLNMMRFASLWRFDHEKRIIERYNPQGKTVDVPNNPTSFSPGVENLYSNMSGDEYQRHVLRILEHIQAGDLYQANLTRKFHGSFASPPHSFSLFRNLCRISPAPYSAFLKLGNTSILSSSPELFLKVGHDGSATSRPIKGTSPRYKEAAADMASLIKLSESDKDKAENLMIVDLMRNDLSRGCLPGSIRTSHMFEVTSHANVHHMSTTVHGQKRPDCSTLDLVRYCFPPGSMTGAPKIQAMKLCSELEKQSRGVYAGAIGFFDGAGGCELSVVIRTLVIQGKAFEFQVGGGIVADSTPQLEAQETFDKASGILAALGLPPERLQKL